MNYKRYLVEFDTGVDLHGMDATKAAKKAVKNAMSHCCMCGMEDLLNLENFADAIRVDVRIGCPVPQQVNVEEIKALLPYADVAVEVVPGGLSAKGLHVPALGEGDSILMVNAALTVWVDASQISWQ